MLFVQLDFLYSKLHTFDIIEDSLVVSDLFEHVLAFLKTLQLLHEFALVPGIVIVDIIPLTVFTFVVTFLHETAIFALDYTSLCIAEFLHVAPSFDLWAFLLVKSASKS